MQILDYILLALIVLAAALAVRRIIRDRRAGKCCGAVQIFDLGNSAHARDARESYMHSMCDERHAAYCCGNCAGCTANCDAACAARSDTASAARSNTTSSAPRDTNRHHTL